MLTTQLRAHMTTGPEGRFEIEDLAAWADTMETAHKVRSDPQARISYLNEIIRSGQGDYVPLYLLLQRPELLELREELSEIVAAERHADLSFADSMNRAELAKRIRAAIHNAMLKASANALCRPAFRAQALPGNSNPTFSTFFYYADYLFFTEVAEAASVVTTAGAVAEAAILALAVGSNVPQKKMRGSDPLKAATTAAECRAIAEFIAPLLSEEGRHSSAAEHDGQFATKEGQVVERWTHT